MTENDLAQLQLLQQNLQNILLQKQQFQRQLAEVESALNELETSSQAYKIVGNIMIAAKKADLQKDLKEKKETFDLRFKNFEKQETILQERIEELRKKVFEHLKK